MAKTTKVNNIAILANATELASELAFDVLKRSPSLQRDVGDTEGRVSKSELQHTFAAKLGSKLNGQRGGVQ